MSKLTPWFDADFEKPQFQYWDGQRWYYGATLPEGTVDDFKVGYVCMQPHRWRGLDGSWTAVREAPPPYPGLYEFGYEDANGAPRPYSFPIGYWDGKEVRGIFVSVEEAQALSLQDLRAEPRTSSLNDPSNFWRVPQ